MSRYDFILTEGDLRSILALIEHRRLASDRPYCLQIHIESGQGNLQVAQATVEILSNEMVAEMRDKGQIDLEEAAFRLNNQQHDTADLSRLLEGTAQQLEAIAKERETDPELRRGRFMGVVQPVFYMLGRHYPELEPVLSRIGRTFVEV